MSDICRLPGVQSSDRRRRYYECEQEKNMNAAEIELADGSTLGFATDGDDLPDVSDAEKLEMYVAAIARAQQIAQERREGRRPPRERRDRVAMSQPLNVEAEIVRLSDLANGTKDAKSSDGDVERLAELGNQLARERFVSRSQEAR